MRVSSSATAGTRKWLLFVFAVLGVGLLSAFRLEAQSATVQVAGGSITSTLASELKQVDAFDSSGNYSSEESLLNQLLTGAADDTARAEIHWRLARVYLNFGDAAKDQGKSDDEAIKIYQKGQSFAELAISENPNSPEGYFWKSGNYGKIGLLRGVLNSLFMIPTVKDLLVKTITFDPNHHDAYFALGQLYAKVPGWPLSFGNIDQAVSLSRRAVDLMESDIAAGKYPNPNYEFYTELANDLYQRNWDSARRSREQAAKKQRYDAATDPLDRGLNYEGVISIPNESDRSEAAAILRRTVATITALHAPRESDLRNMRTAKKMLSDWGAGS